MTLLVFLLELLVLITNQLIQILEVVPHPLPMFQYNSVICLFFTTYPCAQRNFFLLQLSITCLYTGVTKCKRIFNKVESQAAGMIFTSLLCFQPYGTLLSQYLPDDDPSSKWHEYLLHLKEHNLPLDHITLQAVCDVYKVTIRVLTADGVTLTISPSPPTSSISEIHLGHIVGNKFIILHCK